MKKKSLKKLSLKVNTISNLESSALKGGETCESPCQGGTGCCNGGGGNDDHSDGGCKYNILLYWLYSEKHDCFD